MAQVINVYAPLIGVALNIESVPDPVFANIMVGDGIAIDPLDNKIYAPFDGVIKNIPKSMHAITISHKLGFEVLIHIGIETVELDGVGFKILVKEGDNVEAGQIIGEFDLDYVSKAAKSLITPVIFPDLNAANFSIVKLPIKLATLSKPILQINVNEIQDSMTNNDSKHTQLKSEAVTIKNLHGIHARPAAKLANLAKTFSSDIWIEKNNKKVNMKSISSIMKLAIVCKDEVYITADSIEIINQVIELFNNFVDNQTEASEKLVKSDNLVSDSKFYGVIASAGVITGKIMQRKEIKFDFVETCVNPAFEEESLFAAIKIVIKDIQYNLDQIKDSDNEYRDILNSHLFILNDPQIIDDTVNYIKNNYSAAYAFNQVILNNCNELINSNIPYLMERQNDLKDIRNRVLLELDGAKAQSLILNEPTILIADELTTSDLTKIDKNIVGLVSITGGTTSHVAILAKVKGIPLLVNVNNNIMNVEPGVEAVLDCNNGYLDINPDPAMIIEIKRIISEIKRKREESLLTATQVAVTQDKLEVNCYANITKASEVEKLLENGGKGIGLFRTEFIYFDRIKQPTVEEQVEVYNSIAQNLQGLPFTVRTLDAGGEKVVEYINLPFETNPELGVRGIRLSLLNKHLLVEQLTALLKLNIDNLRIMIPMISTLEEYYEVEQIFKQLKNELNNNKKIELGIMVEVPSVVFMAEKFAAAVDFFSIGTNDLSQYTLAIDRQNSLLASRIDHLHPAVINSISMVAVAAKKYNKAVSVCGIMASEKLAIVILIGLGINNLSMPINIIAENKSFIRQLSYADCYESTQECLKMSTTAEIRNYLSNKYQHLIG
ncbi:MAG: phosphoenolpyruvate--protein phosphotransferase [Pseudomonadota bacterium]